MPYKDKGSYGSSPPCSTWMEAIDLRQFQWATDTQNEEITIYWSLILYWEFAQDFQDLLNVKYRATFQP